MAYSILPIFLLNKKYSKYPAEHKLNEEHSVNIRFVLVNIKYMSKFCLNY